MSSALPLRHTAAAVRHQAQLINLSSSSTPLDGVVMKRNCERANVDIDSSAVKATHHLVVVHNRHPARLESRLDGASPTAEFSDGDAIVTPQGLFVGTPLEIGGRDSPARRQPVPGEPRQRADGTSGRVELIPRLRDDLIDQLARNVIAESRATDHGLAVAGPR